MGTRVTIDQDRILRVDEKPYFPITTGYVPEGATPALLSDVGFNTIRWIPFGVENYESDSFQVPDDFGGLMFETYVYNRADFSKDAANRKRELTRLIDAVKGRPDLLCYEQLNEPAYTFQDMAVPQGSAEGMAAGSELIRSLDPHHPIQVHHMTCNLVSTLRKYNAAVDIVGCSGPFVVFPPGPVGLRRVAGMRPDGLKSDSPNRTISEVGLYAEKMMRVAEGRPVWMWIQGSSNENWYDPDRAPEIRDQGLYEYQRLYPNYWQMRFMAFNAIIRGATGLSWQLWRMPVDSAPWSDVCKVVGELRQLHDVLASPNWDATLKIDYTELGFSDWDGVETLVKLCDGSPIILAANTQFDPAITTFSHLPGGLGATIEVVGEDRTIAVSDGRFTDRFQPYEVHVYRPAKIGGRVN